MTLSRRDLFRLASAGFVGGSMSGWIEAIANDGARNSQRVRSCILLWMPGGPSQLDTFDLKPNHENGGPFKPIATSVRGIQISEHLPRLSAMMDQLAVIRSMSTKEGDHSRATYLLRTGYVQQGPVHYPAMGSVISKELAGEGNELPNYVSIAPFRFFNSASYGPGFLGPQHAPLVVGGQAQFGQVNLRDALKVKNLQPAGGLSHKKVDTRLSLLNDLETDFARTRAGVEVESHKTAYRKAVQMTRSDAVRAFDLDEEPSHLRDDYGRNPFGQGCLLARRLVERGVPFVEVSLNSVPSGGVFGWDTHQNNFSSTRQLSQVLDPGWASLLKDLRSRGMLESTLVVWMGEFGRTPKINGNTGRDHFPAAWTTVLSGGGVNGGQVIGRTSRDGMTVEDRPVSVGDLMATVCRSLGLDPMKQNMSNVGRPIRLADPEAKPIEEALV
jgi:uncharacterized protein (DUF1501 family)